MTRALSTHQAEIATRAGIAAITLLVLRLYSNRAAGTVGETYYLATRPVSYDYGNTGTDREFWPLISSVGDLAASMSHLPSPLGGELLRKPLTIDLANEVWEGTRFATTLRANYPLENATVELAQVLLNEHPLGARVDLSSFTGEEHTVLYRGRVRTASPVDEERITLQCEVEQPRVAWRRATDALTVEPRDLGVRLPEPYGAAKRVPCVSLDVGWLTTLAEGIDKAATPSSVEVTDATGLPDSGSFTLRIGNEEITATKVDATHINVTARAQNSTADRDHGRGEGVLEVLSDMTWALANGEISDLQRLYLRNPLTGDLVALRDQDYNVTPYDVDSLDEDFSRQLPARIASFTMEQSQLRTVLDEFAAQVDVEGSGSETQFEQNPSSRSTQTSDTAVSNIHRQVSSAATGRVTYSSTQADEEFIRAWFPASTFSNPTDEVVEYRYVVTCSGTAASSTAGASFRGTTTGNALPGGSSSYTWSQTGVFGQFSFTLSGTEKVSSWIVPPAGTTLADFEGDGTTSNPYFDLKQTMRTGGGTQPLGAAHDVTQTVTIEFKTVATALGNANALRRPLRLFARVLRRRRWLRRASERAAGERERVRRGDLAQLDRARRRCH